MPPVHVDPAKVCEFARFDRALDVLLVRSVGAVDRPDTDSFVNIDALLGSPDVALRVGARYFRAQRHHGLEGTGWVIGCLGWTDAGVEESTEGEHIVYALGAVLFHFFTMIVGIG